MTAKNPEVTSAGSAAEPMTACFPTHVSLAEIKKVGGVVDRSGLVTNNFLHEDHTHCS